MSRNFPTWDQTHWDYEKGNLDAADQALRGGGRPAGQGPGRLIHFFALGQTMEQEDVGWLSEIVAAGHPVGNHTYDHVNVKATRAEDIQFRFRRAPWLIEGKTPAEIIAANIRLAESALKQEARDSPGGFPHAWGIQQRPGRPPRPSGDAPEDGLLVGEQQVPCACDCWTLPASHPIQGHDQYHRRAGIRPSRSSIRRAWSRSR